MKSFKEVFTQSLEVKKQKEQERIKAEKKALVGLLLEGFMETDIKKLSKSELKSLKTSLLECWNPKKGLNRKGKGVLYENEEVGLNPNSTEEQLKKFIIDNVNKQEYQGKWRQSFAEVVMGDTEHFVTMIDEISSYIAKQIKKPIDPKQVASVVVTHIVNGIFVNPIKEDRIKFADIIVKKEENQEKQNNQNNQNNG